MHLIKRKLLVSIILTSFLLFNIFQYSQTKGIANTVYFIDLSFISTSAPRDLYVDKDYLYIADEIDGLLIYDISNKAFPGFETSVPFINATSVSVLGYNAFVTSKAGLSVVDISNPISPFIITTYSDPLLENLTEVFASGNKVYVNDIVTGVWRFDITNILGMIFEDHYGDPSNSIWFDGYYVYMAQNGSMIQVSQDSSFQNVDAASNINYWDVDVQGSYVYVAANNSLLIYHRNNLQLVGGILPNNGPMIDVSVFGSYAFISEDQEQLRVVDISDLQNLVDLNLTFQSRSLSGILFTVVDQNYIYTINSNNEIDIQFMNFVDVVATETQTTTLTSHLTETETINQTVTANVTNTIIERQTSTTILSVNLTSTIPTYLETITQTNTYNTTVEFTKNTSSALTDEIKFTSHKEGDNAGIPSFIFPLTFISIIIITFIRKKASEDQW